MHAHTMAQDGLKPLNRARPSLARGAGRDIKLYKPRFPTPRGRKKNQNGKIWIRAAREINNFGCGPLRPNITAVALALAHFPTKMREGRSLPVDGVPTSLTLRPRALK